MVGLTLESISSPYRAQLTSANGGHEGGRSIVRVIDERGEVLVTREPFGLGTAPSSWSKPHRIRWPCRRRSSASQDHVLVGLVDVLVSGQPTEHRTGAACPTDHAARSGLCGRQPGVAPRWPSGRAPPRHSSTMLVASVRARRLCDHDERLPIDDARIRSLMASASLISTA